MSNTHENSYSILDRQLENKKKQNNDVGDRVCILVCGYPPRVYPTEVFIRHDRKQICLFFCMFSCDMLEWIFFFLFSCDMLNGCFLSMFVSGVLA